MRNNSAKEFVMLDGIRFYPSSQGYWVGSVAPKKIKRMHIYVWEKHNGPVPKGYLVHHIDGNKGNNSIENLRLVTRGEHASIHSPDFADENRSLLAAHARPAAIEWHKSESGRAWHKEQYAKTIGDKWDDTVTKNCEVCGKPFQCPSLVAYKSRFCSNNCKSQFRRDSGVDNITVSCQICGKQYETNKYAKQKFCSPECRKENRLRKSRERKIKDIVSD